MLSQTITVTADAAKPNNGNNTGKESRATHKPITEESQIPVFCANGLHEDHPRLDSDATPRPRQQPLEGRFSSRRPAHSGSDNTKSPEVCEAGPSKKASEHTPQNLSHTLVPEGGDSQWTSDSGSEMIGDKDHISRPLVPKPLLRRQNSERVKNKSKVVAHQRPGGLHRQKTAEHFAHVSKPIPTAGHHARIHPLREHAHQERHHQHRLRLQQHAVQDHPRHHLVHRRRSPTCPPCAKSSALDAIPPFTDDFTKRPPQDYEGVRRYGALAPSILSQSNLTLAIRRHVPMEPYAPTEEDPLSKAEFSMLEQAYQANAEAEGRAHDQTMEALHREAKKTEIPVVFRGRETEEQKRKSCEEFKNNLELNVFMNFVKFV